MKTTTFLALILAAVAVAVWLPACSSTGANTTASNIASSVASTIDTVAATLADSQTLESTESTIAALAEAGVIDPATAAELTAGAVAINAVSNAVATVTDTTGKALVRREPRSAAYAAYAAVLQAHQAAINPTKLPVSI